MSYVAYAKVTYWNSVTEKNETENIALTQVQYFTEAMKRIENVYANDLIHCEIFLDEESFIILSEKAYETAKLAVMGNA